MRRKKSVLDVSERFQAGIAGRSLQVAWKEGVTLGFESGNTSKPLRLTVVDSLKSKEAGLHSLYQTGNQHANLLTLLETVTISNMLHRVLCTPQTVLCLFLSDGFLLNDQRPGPSLLLSVAR